MKQLLIFGGLALFVFSFGCQRKCKSPEIVGLATLNEAALSWMPDDDHRIWRMIDSQGFAESWSRDFGGTGNILVREATDLNDCTGYEYEYTNLSFNSSLSTYDFDFGLSSSLNETSMHFNLGNYYVTYRLESGTLVDIQGPDGRIDSYADRLNAYAIDSVVYTDVLHFYTFADFVEFPEFYYGRGIGLLWFRNRSGREWKRLP